MKDRKGRPVASSFIYGTGKGAGKDRLPPPPPRLPKSLSRVHSPAEVDAALKQEATLGMQVGSQAVITPPPATQSLGEFLDDLQEELGKLDAVAALDLLKLGRMAEVKGDKDMMDLVVSIVKRLANAQ